MSSWNTSRNRALIGIGVLGAIVVAVVVADRDGNDPEPVADSVAIAADESDEPTGAEVAGNTEPAPEPDVPDLPNRGVHPELRGITGWLQSDVTSLEELRGDVVAVQFWTFGCHNCTATLPHMQALYEKYQDQGFEIVGIHAPEFEYEADVDNIVEAAAELGVTWPIALDPTKNSFHFWQEGRRGFWPRIYLIDRDGNVRYDHHGEGRYDEIDAAVGALLAEPA